MLNAFLNVPLVGITNIGLDLSLCFPSRKLCFCFLMFLMVALLLSTLFERKDYNWRHESTHVNLLHRLWLSFFFGLFFSSICEEWKMRMKWTLHSLLAFLSPRLDKIRIKWNMHCFQLFCFLPFSLYRAKEQCHLVFSSTDNMMLISMIFVSFHQFKWKLVKKATQVFYLHFALKKRAFIEEIHEKQEQVCVNAVVYFLFSCFLHVWTFMLSCRFILFGKVRGLM